MKKPNTPSNLDDSGVGQEASSKKRQGGQPGHTRHIRTHMDLETADEVSRYDVEEIGCRHYLVQSLLFRFDCVAV
jgi:hypothetical protein